MEGPKDTVIDRQLPAGKHKWSAAIVVFSLVASGAERRATRLALTLAQANNTNRRYHLILNNEVFAALSKQADLKEELSWLSETGRLHVLPKWMPKVPKPLHSFLNAVATVRLASKLGISMVHCYLGAHVIGPIARMRGLSCILEITSPDVAARLRKPVRRFIANSFDALTCVSPGVATRVAEQRLRPPIFRAPVPFYIAQNKLTYDCAPREMLVVFASRLIPRKNPVLFARIVARFLQVNPEWKVALLGSGPLEGEVREILREYGDAERIIIGHSDNVRAVLRRCLLFVSLIVPDNYPSQSVLEAMDEGAALLLSDTGDSELFLDGTNGSKTPLDEAALLNSLNELVSSREKLEKMGYQSRLLLRQRFSPNVYQEWLASVHGQVQASS